MSTESYLDFELSVEQIDGRYRVAVLESPVGEPSTTIDAPFTRQEIEQIRATLDPTAVLGQLPSERDAIARQFGERLFKAIFQASPEIYAAYLTSLDRAQGKGLSIKLSLDEAGDLCDAPWELLRDPRQDYLAFSKQTTIVRYPRLLTVRPRVAVAWPLRVLVMISSPKNLPPLDEESEWRRLWEATADLRAQGLISLHRLDDATLLSLQRRLRGSDFHIFHYIGHGDYDENTGKGALLFEDPRGENLAYPVTGEELARELSEENSIRLVILNSCESAISKRADPFSGVASSVVARGIPAVVAMQFPISDQGAQIFAEEFYRTVIEGFRLDQALSEARRTMSGALRGTEWATPVLYTRSPGEPLFDLRPGAAPPTLRPAPDSKPPRPTPWRAILAALGILVVLIVLALGANAIFNPPIPTNTPTPTPVAFADLVIEPDSIRTSPAQPSPGRPFILSVSIRNVGQVSSGLFNVAWQPSQLEPQLIVRVANPIPPGGMGEVRFTHTYGWWSSYNTAITLDVDNEVTEITEAGNAERNNTAPYLIEMSEDSFDIDFSQLPGNVVVNRTRFLEGGEFAAWGFQTIAAPAPQDTRCTNARPRLEVSQNRVNLVVGLTGGTDLCTDTPVAFVFERAIGALEATFIAETDGVHRLVIYGDSAGTREIGRVEANLLEGEQVMLRAPVEGRLLIRRVEFISEGSPLRVDRVSFWPR